MSVAVNRANVSWELETELSKINPYLRVVYKKPSKIYNFFYMNKKLFSCRAITDQTLNKIRHKMNKL